MCVTAGELGVFGKIIKKPTGIPVGYAVISGDEGDRTPDLSVANAALSQLSYIPDAGGLYITYLYK
jgi:hypothetical protein